MGTWATKFINDKELKSIWLDDPLNEHYSFYKGFYELDNKSRRHGLLYELHLLMVGSYQIQFLKSKK